VAHLEPRDFHQRSLVVGMVYIEHALLHLGSVKFAEHRVPVDNQHSCLVGEERYLLEELEARIKVVAVVVAEVVAEVHIVAVAVVAHRQYTVAGLGVVGCLMVHQQSMGRLENRQMHYTQIEGYVGLLVNHILR
jgi:hypothetical protein